MKFEKKYDDLEESLLDELLKQTAGTDEFERIFASLREVNYLKEKVKQNEFARETKDAELDLEAERNRIKQDEINLEASRLEHQIEREEEQAHQEKFRDGLKFSETVFSGLCLLAGIGYCCRSEQTTIPSRNGLSFVKGFSKFLTR